MTEWTEDWVRGAAGWKPFKEGKAMLVAGKGSEFKQRENICQATFKEGRMNLRTTVKVVGPADVRVQCGCVENRATGAICAHAVAVLLGAILGSKRPSGTGAPAASARPGAALPVDAKKAALVKPPSPVVAWEIRLSPRYAEELAGGRLSLRLAECAGEVTAADRRLSEWLPYSSGSKIHALQVAGPLLASFLDSAVEHPRISREGASADIIQILADPAPALALSDSRLDGDKVTLRMEPISGKIFGWGGVPALASGGTLAKLPISNEDPRWLAQANQLLSVSTVTLPVEMFLAEFDAWSDLFETQAPGWLGSLKLAGEAPSFHLALDGNLEDLSAVLSVAYPGCRAVPLPPFEEKIPGLPRLVGKDAISSRQIDIEKQAIRRLRMMGFDVMHGNGRLRMQDEHRISGFFADDLRALSADWKISTSDRLNQSLKGLKVIRPVVEKTGGHGDSLSFELSFQTADGTHIPMQEVRRLLGGSRRHSQGRGSGGLLMSRDCEELVAPLISEFEIGRPDQPFTLRGPSALAFESLRKFLTKSQNDNALDELAASFDPVGIRAQLRSYQKAGAAWLIERLEAFRGALLADEMGLGKTLQTIASINHFRRSDTFGSAPALVLVPTSLIGNWSSEIERFAPDLNVVALHGTGRDRLRPAAEKADVVLTSYGTLVRDLAFHLQREYSLIVADEASVLRNATTDVSKSLYKLKAGARLALTGTPVENRIRDLWSVFRFIAPGYLGTQADFQERYEPQADNKEIPQGALRRLRVRISPFVLRRTKEEVAGDLPEKIEIDEWLPMEAGQAKLYAGLAKAGLAEIDRLRDKQGDSAGRMHLLTLLLRLRQICVDPALLKQQNSDAESSTAGSGASKQTPEASVKIDRLLELLDERFETGGKTLVFSQFSSNLRNIRERLNSAFGQVFLLDGSTRNRAELVTQFQAVSGPAVFLISIKAGGYGLNLTAADAVVHMDPWWNPAVEAQATDRAHRIGQTKPVTVYRLLTRDTVEERVRRMQDHKRAIINATTGDSEEPTNWSMDDLEGLLR